MFKNFFMGIAAMAALTLVSCSSDDLNSLSDTPSKNEAISFDSYLGRSAVSVNGSRGSMLDKIALQKPEEGFGVFGNYNEANDVEFGSNWFDNVHVTYSSTDTKWKYSPVQYWLPQGHIDFLAYAPYDSKYDKKVTKDNQKLEFIVSSTIKDQKDLLWANATNQTKANKPVTFTFKHALSKLGYTVKLNNAYSDATFTLTKITLAGSSNGAENAFYTTGTIDLSKTSSEGLWKTSPSDAKQKFDWFSGTQTLATTDYKNPDADYLFVIPQKFSAPATDKLYVIVEYTIEGYKGVTTPMTNTVYKQLEKNFEQGMAYTINLTLGLTPIEFDVTTVEGWSETEQKEPSWN